MKVERLVVGALQTNCYIVADDNGTAVIIDPGGDALEVENYITENNLKPAGILLTHGHPDHVFDAGQLQRTFDKLEIVMHQNDTEQITGNLDIASLFYDMSQFINPNITRFVEDGDIIRFGNLEFQVIHTPGHTRGGVCYLCDNSLFVGDTLFSGSVGRTDLPGGSFDDLIKSIKTKLFPLKDDTTVYPGHGNETTIGTEKQFNPFVG